MMRGSARPDMAFDGLLVTEIFHSLQGETSHAGLRYAFIRLTGCNLRCTYCDSAYAFKGGTRMRISEVLERIAPFQVKHVLITGGEPLLQRQTPQLAKTLRDSGYRVSIETHGEISIAAAAPYARIVMDVKTPGSGMNRGGWAKNLGHLKVGDEVKFVLTSVADYDFACQWIRHNPLPAGVEVLLSPVVASREIATGLDLTWLAEKIIADRLNVRMQTQLHKQIWGPARTGV